ncbi:serine hydrolase [Thermomonas carbonis]|uniref:Serine hydrolase n=1 Tax=Thermomonas carbonis TaxID=1463158 RepID=A0A7G9SPH7_9GAMM|nr:serine hydrolase [Thermomonas carbonis]QNN69752.1 serine hydrolase [Thermomonas carbonis]
MPLAQAAPATGDAFNALAQAIEKFKEDTRYPAGTAVIVVKNGRIAYQGYFGLADIATNTPVDADTVFYIASATKPFFALNALLAEHAGKLDTHTSLQAMFPDARFRDFDANAVTGKHLLTHTSGIDNVPLGWATAFSGVHDEASLRRLVLASRANAEAPLGTLDYSNIGYNIASLWLDRSDTAPWQAQLQARLFAPLGMRHTTARVSEAEARGWTIAKPHAFVSADRNVPLYLRKTDATMHAAGGMLSTAPDLANFLIAQLDHGKLGRKQVLPASIVHASQQQQVTTDSKYLGFPRDGYAWGWYTGTYKGRRMLHHFGGFAGFHAHLSFMPDANIGLVVLNNEDVLGARLTNVIADVAYGIALNEPGIATNTDARFAQLVVDTGTLEQAALRQRDALKVRPWRLSLPRAAYAGRYVHADLGEMTVSLQAGDTLAMRWGQLQAVASGYDQPEHVRIELVPNSGNVLEFVVDAGKVEALVLDGMRFDKQR